MQKPMTEIEEELEIKVAEDLGNFRKRNNETIDEAMIRINTAKTIYPDVAELYRDAVLTKHRSGRYMGSKLWKIFAKGTSAYDSYYRDQILQIVMVIMVVIFVGGLLIKITGGV